MPKSTAAQQRFAREIYLRRDLETCLPEAREVVAVASLEKLDQLDQIGSSAWSAAEILRQFERFERGVEERDLGVVGESVSKIKTLRLRLPWIRMGLYAQFERESVLQDILESRRQGAQRARDGRQRTLVDGTRTREERNRDLIDDGLKLRDERPSYETQRIARELGPKYGISIRQANRILKGHFSD